LQLRRQVVSRVCSSTRKKESQQALCDETKMRSNAKRHRQVDKRQKGTKMTNRGYERRTKRDRERTTKRNRERRTRERETKKEERISARECEK